jgi:hypothetical protein
MKMHRKISLMIALILCSSLSPEIYYRATILEQAPKSKNSPIWEKINSLEFTTSEFTKPVKLRCAVHEDTIYFRVDFFVNKTQRLHRPWHKNKKSQQFEPRNLHEDSISLRFEMPSAIPREVRNIDTWYWGANRTSGTHADDLSQVFSKTEIFRSSSSGTQGARCFTRTMGDTGKASWKLNLDQNIMHMNRSRYLNTTPSGSRADILTETYFKDGWWSITFARRMNTGNPDDLLFEHGSIARLDIVKTLESTPGPFHPDPAGRADQKLILLEIPELEGFSP